MVSPRALSLLALALMTVSGEVRSQVYEDENGSYCLFPVDGSGKLVKAYLKSSKSKGVRPRTSVADDVGFFLHTKKCPLVPERIRVSNICLQDSSCYCPRSPLKFIIHGFGGSAEDGPANKLLGKYLDCADYGDMNIIVVDWSSLAAEPWYDVASANTQYVGYRVAELISYLVSCEVADLDNIHIIGFSLGAHVAGFAGKYCEKMMGKKVARVTALDPAGPLFENKHSSERVDYGDAKFVDVHHFASKSLLEGGLSLSECVGHADFYPNGGCDQPGCALDMMSICSHQRTVWAYAESICHPKRFRSCNCNCWDDFQRGLCPCTDSQYMGEHVSPNASGSYFLCTNGESPFSCDS